MTSCSKISIESIKTAFDEEGLVFIASLEIKPETVEYLRFESWLASGKHGDMKFLENNRECRRNPQSLLDDSRSIIVFGMPYYQGDKIRRGNSVYLPRFAQYARLRDYHKIMKRKGESIHSWLSSSYGQTGHCRVVVDSAPLLERALASRGQMGFIGKNTCFIHLEAGSYLLLGEVFTTLNVETQIEGGVDHSKRGRLGGCGTCKRCQINCPTGALSVDYQLDANLCLAYQTIENRGTIPVQFWNYLADFVFGCDICQMVCPFNRGVRRIEEKVVYVKDPPNLIEILFMDQKYYESKFGGTPLTRAKRSGLRRNALISLIVRNEFDWKDYVPRITQESDPLLLATLDQVTEWQEEKDKLCRRSLPCKQE